jgi:hypothetical protein
MIECLHRPRYKLAWISHNFPTHKHVFLERSPNPHWLVHSLATLFSDTTVASFHFAFHKSTLLLRSLTSSIYRIAVSIVSRLLFRLLCYCNKYIVTSASIVMRTLVFIVALLRNCNNFAPSILTATLTLLGQGNLTYATPPRKPSMSQYYFRSESYLRCVLCCSNYECF